MTDATPSSAGIAVPPVVCGGDDLSLRESLEMLIAAGWRPAFFGSADAFLNAPATSTPSCLLLYVNMPDSNGLDLQGMITLSFNRMPFIFISATRTS